MDKPSRWTSEEQINQIYSYHPPADEIVKQAHENIRLEVGALARWLNAMLAECSQKTHLLNQVLPEIMMRANQIVAINGVHPEYREDCEPKAKPLPGIEHRYYCQYPACGIEIHKTEGFGWQHRVGGGDHVPVLSTTTPQ